MKEVRKREEEGEKKVSRRGKEGSKEWGELQGDKERSRKTVGAEGGNRGKKGRNGREKREKRGKSGEKDVRT